MQPESNKKPSSDLWNRSKTYKSIDNQLSIEFHLIKLPIIQFNTNYIQFNSIYNWIFNE